MNLVLNMYVMEKKVIIVLKLIIKMRLKLVIWEIKQILTRQLANAVKVKRKNHEMFSHIILVLIRVFTGY